MDAMIQSTAAAKALDERIYVSGESSRRKNEREKAKEYLHLSVLDGLKNWPKRVWNTISKRKKRQEEQIWRSTKFMDLQR